MYEGESRTILQDTYSPASGAKHTTPDDQSGQWQTEKRPSTCFFNQHSIFDVIACRTQISQKRWRCQIVLAADGTLDIATSRVDING